MCGRVVVVELCCGGGETIVAGLLKDARYEYFQGRRLTIDCREWYVVALGRNR